MTETLHPVLVAAGRYRQQLLNQEDAAVARLVAAYGTSYQRLGAQIEALQQASAGQRFTIEKATRFAQLRALREQVAGELARFGVIADNELTQLSRQGIALGLNHSTGLVEAYFRNPQTIAAVRASMVQLVPEQVETLLGFLAPESPLRQGLTTQLGPAVSERLSETMVDGLTRGLNPRAIADIVRREYGQGLTWALNTVRTANLWSYREATRANYVANSRVVSGWTWYATLDRRVCFSCIAQHGTKHSVDEVLNDHHQGRCLTPGQMVITIGGSKPIEDIVVGDIVLTHKGRYRRVTAISQRDYTGTVHTFTQNGASVITTPEHPLLTQRGWVEAKDCNASDTFLTLKDVLVRASSRNTVQPSSLSLASFFWSSGRFLFELCQRGSSSTANFALGNAKSILYPSMANWGMQARSASSSAFRNASSPAVQNSRQLTCRPLASVLARFAFVSGLNNFSKNASGSISLCRVAASLEDIGSMPWSLIQRISVRVLMPSSAQISRYVAFSSKYLRRSHWSTGSPSFSVISASNRSEISSPHFTMSRLRPSALARWSTALCERFGNSNAMSWCNMVSKLSSMIWSSSFVQKYIRYPFILNELDYGNIIHHPSDKVNKSTYSGPVYNLQVEEDESYIAGEIVVHNCVAIPDVPLASRLGIDLPEIEPGETWFNRQDEETQVAIMGPGMLAAYQADALRFDQASTTYDDPNYGPMRRTATMAELGLEEYYQR